MGCLHVRWWSRRLPERVARPQLKGDMDLHEILRYSDGAYGTDQVSLWTPLLLAALAKRTRRSNGWWKEEHALNTVSLRLLGSWSSFEFFWWVKVFWNVSTDCQWLIVCCLVADEVVGGDIAEPKLILLFGTVRRSFRRLGDSTAVADLLWFTVNQEQQQPCRYGSRQRHFSTRDNTNAHIRYLAAPYERFWNSVVGRRTMPQRSNAPEYGNYWDGTRRV